MSTLAQLRDQFRQAHQAAEAHFDELTAKYEALYPQPYGESGPPTLELVLERSRAWTKPERAELDRLRADVSRIAVEIDEARRARSSRT